MRARRPDGAVMWLESQACLSPSGIIMTMRDVTDRVLREKDLIALAHTDSLTGLPNRRALNEHLERACAGAAVDGSSVAVLMVDVDCFKLFNDRFGHQAGDECLFSVAAELQSILGKHGGVIARYGGEEFAAVLTDCDGPAASQKAEEVRAAVEGLRICHPDTERGYVTVSIGMAAARIEFQRSFPRCASLSCGSGAVRGKAEWPQPSAMG